VRGRRAHRQLPPIRRPQFGSVARAPARSGRAPTTTRRCGSARPPAESARDDIELRKRHAAFVRLRAIAAITRQLEIFFSRHSAEHRPSAVARQCGPSTRKHTTRGVSRDATHERHAASVRAPRQPANATGGRSNASGPAMCACCCSHQPGGQSPSVQAHERIHGCRCQWIYRATPADWLLPW